jgi:hypothetical protein
MRRILLSFLPCLLSAQALPGPAHVQTFQATAPAVRRGTTVTLRWNVTGTDQVRLDPVGLILPAKGEITHVVMGRTIYWLHANNAAGGQSAPLVVDVLPEETLTPAPALLLPAQAPVPPEPPRLAALPPVPALQAPLPAVVPTARIPRRVARRLHNARPFWIQFAALVSPRGAARLQRSLLHLASADSTTLVRPRRSGRPYHLVRMGPFATPEGARMRLEELAPAVKALRVRPIIVQGPPPPLAGATYVADNHLVP